MTVPNFALPIWRGLTFFMQPDGNAQSDIHAPRDKFNNTLPATNTSGWTLAADPSKSGRSQNKVWSITRSTQNTFWADNKRFRTPATSGALTVAMRIYQTSGSSGSYDTGFNKLYTAQSTSSWQILNPSGTQFFFTVNNGANVTDNSGTVSMITGQWITWVARWTQGGTIDLTPWNDSGHKIAGGSASASASNSVMNFDTGQLQAPLFNGYLDYAATWGRYVSDAQIAHLVINRATQTAPVPVAQTYAWLRPATQYTQSLSLSGGNTTTIYKSPWKTISYSDNEAAALFKTSVKTFPASEGNATTTLKSTGKLLPLVETSVAALLRTAFHSLILAFTEYATAGIVYQPGSANSGTISASATSYVVTPGVNPAVGDLMIVGCTAYLTSFTVTPPSGWILLENSSYDGGSIDVLYYKLASSADTTAGSFTFSASPSITYGGVWGYSSYGGVSQTSPIDTNAGYTNSGGTTYTAPSIIPTGSADLFIGVYFIDGWLSQSPTVSGSTNLRLWANDGGAGSIIILDKQLAASGATGTVTVSGNTGGTCRGYSIAVTPALASPTLISAMAKMMPKMFSASEGNQTGLTKLAQKIITAVSEGSAASVLASWIHAYLFWYHDPTAANMTKSISKIVSIGEASAYQVIKSTKKAFPVSEGSQVSLLKMANKLMAVSETIAATLKTLSVHVLNLLVSEVSFPGLLKLITKTATVAETTALGFSRMLAKQFGFSETSQTRSVKAILKMIPYSESETPLLSRASAKLLSTNETSAYSLVKTAWKTLATSEGYAGALVRIIGKLANYTDSTAVSLAQRSSHFFTLVVAEPTAAILTKIIQKVAFSWAEANTVSLVVGRAVLHTLNVAVSYAAAISTIVQIGRILAFAETTATSLIKAMTKSFSLTETTAVILTRLLPKRFSVAESTTYSLGHMAGKMLAIAESAQTNAARLISKLATAAVTALPLITKMIPKSYTYIEAAGVSVVKQPEKTLYQAEGTTMSLLRSVGKIESVVTLTAVVLTRMISKGLSLLSGTAASVYEIFPVLLAATVHMTEKLTRSVGKPLGASLSAGVGLLFGLFMPLFTTSTMLTALHKTPAKILAGSVATAEMISRSMGKTVKTTAGSLGGLIKTIGHTLGLTQGVQLLTDAARPIVLAVASNTVAFLHAFIVGDIVHLSAGVGTVSKLQNVVAKVISGEVSTLVMFERFIVKNLFLPVSTGVRSIAGLIKNRTLAASASMNTFLGRLLNKAMYFTSVVDSTFIPVRPTPAAARLIELIDQTRAYILTILDVQEAKIVLDTITFMLSRFPMGSATFDAATAQAEVQAPTLVRFHNYSYWKITSFGVANHLEDYLNIVFAYVGTSSSTAELKIASEILRAMFDALRFGNSSAVFATYPFLKKGYIRAITLYITTINRLGSFFVGLD